MKALIKKTSSAAMDAIFDLADIADTLREENETLKKAASKVVEDFKDIVLDGRDCNSLLELENLL